MVQSRLLFWFFHHSVVWPKWNLSCLPAERVTSLPPCAGLSLSIFSLLLTGVQCVLQSCITHTHTHTHIHTLRRVHLCVTLRLQHAVWHQLIILQARCQLLLSSCSWTHHWPTVTQTHTHTHTHTHRLYTHITLSSVFGFCFKMSSHKQNSGRSYCDITHWLVEYVLNSRVWHNGCRHFCILQQEVTIFGREGGAWENMHFSASILIGSDRIWGNSMFLVPKRALQRLFYFQYDGDLKTSIMLFWRRRDVSEWNQKRLVSSWIMSQAASVSLKFF